MDHMIVHEADVESLVSFIEGDTSSGAAQRQAALRQILTAVGVQAHQMARLQRALQLDDAAMREIIQISGGGGIAAQLRAAAGSAVDAALADQSLASIQKLERDLAEARTAREKLLSLARFALTVAVIVAK